VKRIFPADSLPASISHDGHQIDIPAEGRELPDPIADVFLSSHGFVDKDPNAPQDGVKIVEKIVEIEKPENNDPASAPASGGDVDKMNRAELFASLKAVGVGVQLPRSNDELRQILKDELAKREEAAKQPKETQEPPKPGEPGQPADQAVKQ